MHLIEVLADELLADADSVAGLAGLRRGFLERNDDTELLLSLAQPRDTAAVAAALVLALDVGVIRRDDGDAPPELLTQQGGGA